MNETIKHLLLTGFGGGLGSACRYLTTIFVNRYCTTVFPLATFTVNVSGCFLMGLIFGLTERSGIVAGDMKLFLMTGFCGGYTTFSAFSAENMKLLHEGNYAVFAMYAASSVATGILAFLAGDWLSKS